MKNNKILSFPNFIPNHTRSVSVPRQNDVAANDVYSYQLRGDGLKQFAIFDGDFILIDKNLPVRDGDFAFVELATGQGVFKILLEAATVGLVGERLAIFKPSEVKFIGRVFRIERDLGGAE